MKKALAFILCLVLLAAAAPLTPASAAGDKWDGTVDISWYDPSKTEYYISTPAQLAGLAALVNGMVDPTCPAVIGDRSLLVSVPVDDVLLVGAGGGNVSDTVYTSPTDFSHKTVRLTADMDMGGVYNSAANTWSGPNWTPIGGKFPLLPGEVAGDCLTLDTRFNGVLDGQGHEITNLCCDRYAAKGFPYSMAIGVVGFLGGLSDAAGGSTTAEFDDGWQPAVKNLVLRSGSVLGRRMVGGIVGRVGETSNGVVVENCANFARVKSTDAKGVGGVVGSGWGDGVIRNCYNAGYITTTYSSPAGGIVGTNGGMDVYNCYNIGTIDTNGQQRGRPIGSHDSGVYTVDNCYFLAGTGDDPSNPGYYKGVSQKISVSVTEMTAERMRSGELLGALNANGAAFAADVNGINGGCPVLWFQNGTQGGECRITVAQPASGGTVSVEGPASVPYGTVVTMTSRPATGYTLEYYTVDGAPVASDFFLATADATVSAVFRRLVTVSFSLSESPDLYAAVSRSGWKQEGGGLVWVERDILRSGDVLYQGNVLTVLTHGYEDAVPADMDLEFTDAFVCDVTGASKNADGTYTVTGERDVNVSVTRSTQAKSWLGLADVEWYVSGGRKTEYVLTTPEELAGLAYLVNKRGVSFEGVTIKLGNDISLDNTDGTTGLRLWTPVGSNANKPFRGTFDGQGHAVYDMTVRSSASGAALFGYCSGAEIRSVSVYGAVTGTASASYAAGVAASMSGGRIENCLNFAPVTASGTHAGGICALTRDGAVIDGCFNCAAVTASSGVGGIVGVSDAGTDTISNCANFGPVRSTGNGTYGTGGIAGRLSGAVEGCVNYADVGGTDRYTGGVAGYMPGRNTSAAVLSANRGAVSSDNSMATAALGGVAGYAQFAKLEAVENTGSVLPGAAFAGSSGELIGREGTVALKEKTGDETVPEYARLEARTFPADGRTEFSVTFVADGNVVAVRQYRPGASGVSEPAVPAKEGHTGSWSPYALGAKDVVVNAVYRQRLVAGGGEIRDNGTYYVAWFSTGTITVAPGVKAVIDGSNGGASGFDGLEIITGRGAQLTLRDVTIGSEKSMLVFEGGNVLAVEGEDRLVSRTEDDDGLSPAIRADGDLTVTGGGSLYISAGIKNTAITLTSPGSVLTLRGPELSVYKEDLLGVEGGAVNAPGSSVRIESGVLKGRTVSDNVSVIYADTVALTGGKLLVQAERSPLAVDAAVTASGGEIAAYGHTGNSASFSQAYQGADALRSYSGSAAFAELLPFTDVFVTDAWYDAVKLCYERGYFKGTSATTFSPDMHMTRAMFVTVLYRLAGSPAVSGSSGFTDLTADWYLDAVTWAVERGVTTGTSATTFTPDEPVTREQAAVFLYRYARAMGDVFERDADAEITWAGFSDWARPEALWAMSSGIFSGTDGSRSRRPAPRGAFSRRSLQTIRR